ncbi:AsmA family protein [Magnetovibrio sp. PR-2]|uniref:AsmA family protein n=1 Tax=Magnetovibrio sp. PR-2 TaxID=3120356 RepID=UPI002FCE1830
MARFFKIIFGLGVLCIALLASLGVMLKSSDYSRVKVQLDRIVERATGRPFVIAGDLQFNLSLTPSLSVSDVHLANADWGSTDDMMVLEHLEAQVDLMALLKGHLDINYVVIEGLRLNLETDGKGLTNWEFRAAQAPTEKENATASKFKLNPSVHDVRLTNIRTVYKDGATGMTFESNLKSARFQADSFDAALRGGFVGVFNGVTLDANARMGSLAQILSAEPKPFPFKLEIDGPDISANLDATLQHPGRGLDISADFAAQVFDPQFIGKLLNLEGIPDLGEIELGGKVTMVGKAVSFLGLEAQTKDFDIGGALSVRLSDTRPSVKARLRSETLDITSFFPKTDSISSGDKVFSTDEIDIQGLDALDAQVDFVGKEIKYQDLSATDVRAKVKLKSGAVEIQPASFIFDQARIDYTATLKPSASGMDVHTKASLRNFNVGTVTALSGQGDLLDLKMDGEILLIAKGKSAHELAGSTNGHVKMIGRNGRIHDHKIVELTESVTSILPWASNKDANAISCVLAEVPIAEGLATAKSVVVDTSGMHVKVNGTVDLGEEVLKLHVNTDAKSTSLASFAVPFQVEGSLKKPEVHVTAKEAVVGTLGNIIKTPVKAIAGLLADTISLVESDKAKKEQEEKNDPCVQALKGGKTPEENTAEQ